jgi:hypothetical protein
MCAGLKQHPLDSRCPEPAYGKSKTRRSAPQRRPSTIFHEAWWLNAVTEGDYQEAVVVSSGRVVGSFPYTMTSMMGRQRLCGMPIMTHFLGPDIDEGSGSACNRALRRAQITRELVAQIPSCSGFWQKLHRGTRDTLVYQDMGYDTSVQFTFELRPAPEPVLWANMRDKTRNVIRRAREQLGVAELTDVEAFASIYVRNLEAVGKRSHYSQPLLVRACQAAILHGQGRILAATNASGAVLAAIFYVWDDDAAYYLLSTRSLNAGNGAVSLLLWHAICEVTARGLIFDFEGVVTSGSAFFFNGFGGEVAPRFVVSRFALAHKIADRLVRPFQRNTVVTWSASTSAFN